jgi:hypothetical protein
MHEHRRSPSEHLAEYLILIGGVALFASTGLLVIGPAVSAKFAAVIAAFTL